MKRLAVYCGSATPADPRFIECAREVGSTLARFIFFELLAFEKHSFYIIHRPAGLCQNFVFE